MTRARRRRVVYLNGALVPQEQAKISLLDRGFLYGDGLFETMRAYRGRIFLLEAHLRRIAASAKLLEIPFDPTALQLKQALEQLVAANGLARRDCAVRLILTRGPAPPSLIPQAGCTPTVAALTRPLERGLASLQQKGVDAVFLRHPQCNGILAEHKTLDYLPAILAKRYARLANAYEAIYLGRGGRVLEGSTSNIFALAGEVLRTPATRNILPGITRQLVLELAGSLGMRCRQGSLTMDDMRGADEIFITGSTVEILPIVKLDERRLRVGKATRRLQERYRRYVRETLS